MMRTTGSSGITRSCVQLFFVGYTYFLDPILFRRTDIRRRLSSRQQTHVTEVGDESGQERSGGHEHPAQYVSPPNSQRTANGPPVKDRENRSEGVKNHLRIIKAFSPTHTYYQRSEVGANLSDCSVNLSLRCTLPYLSAGL